MYDPTFFMIGMFAGKLLDPITFVAGIFTGDRKAGLKWIVIIALAVAGAQELVLRMFQETRYAQPMSHTITAMIMSVVAFLFWVVIGRVFSPDRRRKSTS